MANRFADAITFVAEEEIVKAKEIVGTGADKQEVGKAIAYGAAEHNGNPGAVLCISTNAGDFAGIVKAVSAEANVVRAPQTTVPPSNKPSGSQYYNDGDRTVPAGAALTVEADIETLVKCDGAVEFKDKLTVGADGALKAATAGTDVIVGVAHQAGEDGAVILAYIYKDIVPLA